MLPAIRHLSRFPDRSTSRRRVCAVSVVAATVALATTAITASAEARPPQGGHDIDVSRVEPSATGSGITAETDPARFHVVAQPRRGGSPRLVVMLPGSNVAAGGYSDFTEHAARLGHPAVSLAYLNRGTVGGACQATLSAERCFEQARGEIVFGADTPDPQGTTYSSDKVDVDAANSIVGRLVALIDQVAVDDPHWNRYLVKDKSSPYVSEHRGPVRLKYDKMIFAGHSQGGGHAALLGMRTKVERVVMLSSPDDTNLSGTAEWILGQSATPLDRFWGLRHEVEGPYGQHVATVWDQLGGHGVGAGDNTSEVEVGDGSADPDGSHRLVLPGDLGTPLANHMATAYDGAYLAGVPDAWTYLLTAR